MSSLTSSSTDAEVRAAYEDNASYEEDGSVAKAKAFITACRFLLLRLPKLVNQGSAQIAFSPDQIKSEMTRAQTYVAVNGTDAATGGNASVRHAAFDSFR